MIVQSRVSSKGQIVVPKAMRVRQGLDDGADIEMVEQAGGVLVRAKPKATSGPSVDEVLERIWKRSPYTGPPLSDEDIDNAVVEAIGRKFAVR